MNNEVLLALVALAGGLVTKLLDFMIMTYKTKQQKKNQLSNELIRMRDIHQVLQNIVATTDAQRCLVLRMHNGGGRPAFDKPLFISVLYEQYEAPIRSIMRDFQRVQADSNYIELLVDLEKKKAISVTTETLSEGLLRTSYESENINFSEKYYLTHNDHSFYYLSISNTINSQYTTAIQRNCITLSVARLRGLFEKKK